MMTDSIVIELAGEPVPKGRPRFASRGEGHPVAYTPAKTRHYESALKYAAQQVMGARPLLDGPLWVNVVVSRSIPQSWSKKRKAAALVGDIYPTTKPDLDNFDKMLDALNGVVFLDDAQIVWRTSRKVYGEKPSLRIVVQEAA